MTIDRAKKTLDCLELDLAADFVQSVSTLLRRLTDIEINTLYLMMHTGPNMGEEPGRWIACLMPLIEAEADLRRHLQVVPEIGPVVAPDLYVKGGGHDIRN